MNWLIHHKAETVSTNLDARAGHHGDVFTADYQTAGRGRLDHKWLSPPRTNLIMSVVLSVEGLAPDQVATLPLVVGLAATKAVASLVPAAPSPRGADRSGGCYRARDARRVGYGVALKWPNDVLVDGRKMAGILCERNGDDVIAGIGVNVGQTEFDKEIADRATSLAKIVPAAPRRVALAFTTPRSEGAAGTVIEVREAVLAQLGKWYGIWREKGFAAVYPEIAAIDFLKGREISVRQMDDDSSPVSGVSNGIMPDGSLDVGGIRVYAGEAHVEKL